MLYSTTLKNCLQKEVYKITLNSKKEEKPFFMRLQITDNSPRISAGGCCSRE
jgi:hypothetical protein